MNDILPVLVLSACSLASAAPLAMGSSAADVGAVRGDMFAVDLLSQWCDGTANVVYSPYSLSAALGMVAAGSRGETARQIAVGLKLGIPAGELPAHFAAMDSSLAAARKAGSVELAIANSLWPQQNFMFNPAYLDVVRTQFRGEARAVDYVSATEAARQTINQWVAEHTSNRIKDIIAPGILGAATRMTLVNAVYFKGKWGRPFVPQRTTPAPFFAADGRAATVSLMSQSNRFRYSETDGIQELELPYAGDKLAMLVLLPDQKQGLRQVAEVLKKRGLSPWDNKLAMREVSVFLPKFTFTSERSCVDTMRALGIADPFDAARADLSGMAGKPGDLVVSALIHKAFIEVGEEGTEAAATSVGVIAMTSFMPQEPPVIFRADHPFVFLIRERQTGCILFMGAVARPQ